jgi:hypothetical protein
MVTKTDRIRALLAEGKEPSEIAETVGCTIEYVRVVRYRLKAGRDADVCWIAKNPEKWSKLQAAYYQRRKARQQVAA